MTRDRLYQSEGGASFAEVLVAMALTLIGLAGAMGAFQAAERSFQAGTLATRALAMAESRIEAKRAARWDRLLLEDLNYDGVPDLVMRDDGIAGDLLAGDGVYSGMWSQDGVPDLDRNAEPFRFPVGLRACVGRGSRSLRSW